MKLSINLLIIIFLLIFANSTEAQIKEVKMSVFTVGHQFIESINFNTLDAKCAEPVEVFEFNNWASWFFFLSDDAAFNWENSFSSNSCSVALKFTNAIPTEFIWEISTLEGNVIRAAMYGVDSHATDKIVFWVYPARPLVSAIVDNNDVSCVNVVGNLIPFTEFTYGALNTAALKIVPLTDGKFDVEWRDTSGFLCKIKALQFSDVSPFNWFAYTANATDIMIAQGQFAGELPDPIPPDTSNNPECQPPLGNRSIAIFPTFLLLTGNQIQNSRARIDFQLGSPVSPIINIKIYVGEFIASEITGADVTNTGGIWFNIPNITSTSGSFPLSIEAKNEYGCITKRISNFKVVLP